MSQPPDSTASGSGNFQPSRRLQLETVELVGGGRTVLFHPGLNLIQGEISSGKTTFVRLLRGFLSTFPDHIAPESDEISGIRGSVVLGDREWQIFRPRSESRDALVEIAEVAEHRIRDAVTYRLPVAGQASSYSRFLLDRLSIPAVAVPQARNRPTSALTSVSASDWLSYCIVTGDEIDTQVFGHRHPFKDLKRKWVFELAYGYYDPELADLGARLRTLELQLDALEQEAEVQAKFLADTPFANVDLLADALLQARAQLVDARRSRNQVGHAAGSPPGAEPVRAELLRTRDQAAQVASSIVFLEGQLRDLKDLTRQLNGQASRITRAIVSDEWLVDFDFVVCPRCGSDVSPDRVPDDLCYLCEQPPRPGASRDQLLAEQDRITSQIEETNGLIALRESGLNSEKDQLVQTRLREAELASELDRLTSQFVSDRAEAIAAAAAEIARLEGEVRRLEEYLLLHRRAEGTSAQRAELEEQLNQVAAEIDGRALMRDGAEENVRALEARMLTYLQNLNVPFTGRELTVSINRNTYLPEVSGRTFDELSSQGLKTLVNVAHSLAHHSVCVDRDLPMPGLLILDGLSANAGFEGFDQARVRDVYELLAAVSDEYEGRLQIVAVDNELSREIVMKFADQIVLTLSQTNRLIRLEGPPVTPD